MIPNLNHELGEGCIQAKHYLLLTSLLKCISLATCCMTYQTDFSVINNNISSLLLIKMSCFNPQNSLDSPLEILWNTLYSTQYVCMYIRVCVWSYIYYVARLVFFFRKAAIIFFSISSLAINFLQVIVVKTSALSIEWTINLM